MTTFSVSIGAEAAENDVAPGFAVAGLVADTHKSYVQVCGPLRPATLRVITFLHARCMDEQEVAPRFAWNNEEEACALNGRSSMGVLAQTFDVDGKPANRSFHIVAHCDDTYY